MLFPDCLHTQYDIVLCPTGPHYAKKQCRACRQFCGWVVKPENQHLRAERLAKVNELWNGSPSPEERVFLVNLTNADGRMSPRQEARLNGLWARHLVEDEIAHARGDKGVQGGQETLVGRDGFSFAGGKGPV